MKKRQILAIAMVLVLKALTVYNVYTGKKERLSLHHQDARHPGLLISSKARFFQIFRISQFWIHRKALRYASMCREGHEQFSFVS